MKTSSKTKTQNTKYVRAVGRRKTASVSIRLFKGKGINTVNGKNVEKFVQKKNDLSKILKPFELTSTTDKYFFTAKVNGGGVNGQIDAIIHAISRSLINADAKLRSALKSAGLLTRDSRARLRRMVGTGGKARRKKQSPKR